jgi:hypothetical protein
MVLLAVVVAACSSSRRRSPSVTAQRCTPSASHSPITAAWSFRPRTDTAQGWRGAHYSRDGIGLSLLAIPLYLVGKGVASGVGHAAKIEQGAVASVMPLIAAALAVAFFMLSVRLEARPSSVVLVASAVGAKRGRD